MVPEKQRRCCAPPVYRFRNAALNRFKCAKPFNSKFLRCLFDAVNWKAIDDDGGPYVIELGLIDEERPMSNTNVCVRRSVTTAQKRWIRPPPLAQAYHSRAERALFKADVMYNKKYGIKIDDQTALVAHKKAEAVSK